MLRFKELQLQLCAWWLAVINFGFPVDDILKGALA
jgi:hypothetical protein